MSNISNKPSDPGKEMVQDSVQLLDAFLHAILPTIKQCTIDAIVDNHAELFPKREELFPNPSSSPYTVQVAKDRAIDEVVNSIWRDVTRLLDNIRKHWIYYKAILRIEEEMTIYARAGISKIVDSLAPDCQGRNEIVDKSKVDEFVREYVKRVDIRGDLQ